MPCAVIRKNREHKGMNKTEIDIIALLKQDARLTATDIAKTLGMKTEEV